ncbi:unnamed protein product, partial [Urochloa humidicola]
FWSGARRPCLPGARRRRACPRNLPRRRRRSPRSQPRRRSLPPPRSPTRWRCSHPPQRSTDPLAARGTWRRDGAEEEGSRLLAPVLAQISSSRVHPFWVKKREGKRKKLEEERRLKDEEKRNGSVFLERRPMVYIWIHEGDHDCLVQAWFLSDEEHQDYAISVYGPSCFVDGHAFFWMECSHCLLNLLLCSSA